MVRFLGTGLCILLGLPISACKREAARVQQIRTPAAKTGDEPASRPQQQPAEPAEKSDGVVSLTGTYDVDPVPQGKRFQGGWLIPDGNGDRLVLSYRPDPKYFRFIGKRVVVTGRHRILSPYEQHIIADHFAMESIALVPGETPYATIPTRIPAPPLAKTKDELAVRDGKWARVYGRVVTLEVSPDESHYLRKLVVAMPDGHRLEVRNAYLNVQWEKGEKVEDITIIGRASQPEVDAGTAADISFAALCKGHIERCGMTP